MEKEEAEYPVYSSGAITIRDIIKVNVSIKEDKTTFISNLSQWKRLNLASSVAPDSTTGLA